MRDPKSTPAVHTERDEPLPVRGHLACGHELSLSPHNGERAVTCASCGARSVVWFAFVREHRNISAELRSRPTHY